VTPCSTGSLWVYTRSGGPNATIGASRTYINGGSRVFEFDRSGKFLREIGSGPTGRPYSFLFAQGVRVDPQNNFWVVDRASRVVAQFDPSGRVLRALGRRPEAIGELGSSAGGGGGRGGGGAGAPGAGAAGAPGAGGGGGRGGGGGCAGAPARVCGGSGGRRRSWRRWRARWRRWRWRPRWRSARPWYARGQFQPAYRCGLGRCRQHLYHRRL